MSTLLLKPLEPHIRSVIIN